MIQGKYNLPTPETENNVRNARTCLKINTNMNTAVAIENNPMFIEYLNLTQVRMHENNQFLEEST
jgi:hypothetical protein